MPPKFLAVHPVLAVRDVPASVRFFETLGFRLLFQDSPDDPRYAGIRRDDVELHLQWHSAEEWRESTEPAVYRFVVSDVDALSAEFEQSNASLVRTKVWDTDWGTREFHVHDPDKNGLQFYRMR